MSVERIDRRASKSTNRPIQRRHEIRNIEKTFGIEFPFLNFQLPRKEMRGEQADEETLSVLQISKVFDSRNEAQVSVLSNFFLRH